VGTAPDLIALLEAVRRGGAPVLKGETAKAALFNQIGDIPRPGKPGQGFSFLGAVIQDPVLAEVPMSKGSITWGGVYGHNWFIDPVEGISAAIMSNTAVEGCLGTYPRDIARSIYDA
jgi:CubicO group peptidase (beta-lactamase class C family)